MKNKKLFAAALTAALAVSMMGTSVMAYDGTTKFTYTPGTSGPIDPVNPARRRMIQITGWYLTREDIC